MSNNQLPQTRAAKLLVLGLGAAMLPLALTGGQADAPLLEKLPPVLRSAGAEILKEQDPEAKSKLLSKLASANPAAAGKTPDVARFALSLHDAGGCPEQAPTWKPRRPTYPCAAAIVQAFARTGAPELRDALERWATSSPDASFASWTAESLLDIRRSELARLLDKRVEKAQAASDDAALKTLGRAQERMQSRVPSFLWQAPPKFEAFPSAALAARIRVAAIGDFGTGSPAQEAVAATLLRQHHATPFDFGITLGDNYQDDGPHSPDDIRWQTYWARLYPRLGVPFYATLGNHDWGNPDGPPAALLYAAKNPAWRLPALYYTFDAGPVQFFALNTPLLSEAQLLWLREELAKSTARWKVVYGHFQIYSALRGDNPPLIAKLLPILSEHKVDMYLCGHEHVFQHLKPEGGVHFFVNGATGAGGRSARIKPYDRALFMAENLQGFAVLEADAAALRVKFVDLNGNDVYTHALTK